MFWKQLNKIRKGKSAYEVKVKAKDDAMLVEEEAVTKRWTEYLEGC